MMTSFPLLVLFFSLAAPPTTLEKKVLDEINFARTAPKEYVRLLKEYRKGFRGKRVTVGGTIIATREGVRPVDEAIRFLDGTKPMPPLKYAQGLSAAASDLVREEGKEGSLGHTGKKTGGMEERISRHGKWSGSIGENLGYGTGDARMVVMQWIVDDGVPGRGHRRNIFNSSFHRVGTSCGPHATMQTMCAADFAHQYLP